MAVHCPTVHCPTTLSYFLSRKLLSRSVHCCTGTGNTFAVALMKKGKLKKWFGVVHLWFGLASGTVILLVCLLAAIWSFSPELESLTESYRHVSAQEKPFLPVSKLRGIADTLLPGKRVRRLEYYGKDRAAEASYYSGEYYYSAFINPYTGEVLKVKNENRSFFRLVLIGHMTLWLGEVGSRIVRWSTLIFLVMLVSGIVLWWPKNRGARKQRFKLKFGTSPKRLNYDLHNVLGFYGSWFLVFAVLSGLVWTFDSVARSEYWLASGGKSLPAYPSPVVEPGAAKNAAGLDSLFVARVAEHPEVYGAAVSFDVTDSSAVSISVYPTNQYYNADNYYYNPCTLQEIPVNFYGKYKDANGGEKLSRMNYDIHIGNILGFPGRVAMFLAVLIGASLPVTGFYIWLGRRKKTILTGKQTSMRKVEGRNPLPVI